MMSPNQAGLLQPRKQIRPLLRQYSETPALVTLDLRHLQRQGSDVSNPGICRSCQRLQSNLWHPSAIAADARPLSFAAERLVRSFSSACGADTTHGSMDDVVGRRSSSRVTVAISTAWQPTVIRGGTTRSPRRDRSTSSATSRMHGRCGSARVTVRRRSATPCVSPRGREPISHSDCADRPKVLRLSIHHLLPGVGIDGLPNSDTNKDTDKANVRLHRWRLPMTRSHGFFATTLPFSHT